MENCHQFSQNTPPTFIEPINGAIGPVEGGGSKKLEVTICDLKNAADSLRSQIVILEKPHHFNDIRSQLAQELMIIPA
jgi:hypothetical protein